MSKKPISFLAKTTLYVGILSFMIKFLGFFRELLIGYYYGTTYKADAIILSLTLPTIIFAAFQSAIGTSYVPIFSKLKKQKKQDATQFTNNLITILSLVSLLIMLVLLVFNKHVMSMLGGELSTESLSLTTKLTYFVIPSLVFSSVSVVLTSFLQCHEAFKQALLASFPNYVLVIISFFIAPIFGIYVITLMVFIGSIIQLGILYALARRYGYRYYFQLDFRHPNLKSLYTLLVPVTVGIGVQQIVTIVDRLLASSVGEGGIAALNYAGKLNGFIFGIISYAIVTVVFPLMAKMNAKSSDQVNLLENSIKTTNILLIPLIMFTLLFNNEIVKVLFGRGSFTESDIFVTSGILFYYTLGMIFFSYRDILVRVFYAVENIKVPLISGVLTVVLNVAMSLSFIKYLGINGIALGTSLAIAVTTIFLFHSVHKFIGSLKWRNLIVNLCKVFFSSLISILTLYFVNLNLQKVIILNSNFQLLIYIVSMFLVFMGIYFLFFNYINKKKSIYFTNQKDI